MAIEETRVCNKCHIEKSIIEYRYRNDAKLYRRDCRQCERIAVKEWISKNLDYSRKTSLIHYYENKERHKETNILWKARNPEYMSNYNRQYREDNREKENERKRKYNKIKRKTDIKFRFSQQIRKRIQAALKTQRANKNNTTYELIGCSLIELRKYLESLFTEGMKWNNYGYYGWHVDHLIPCAAFDLTDPEQQKTCFHFSNLQPLWAKDNQMKGAKIE